MKVYISGAITNNPHYHYQFGEAEAKLIKEGHAVLNPCKNEGFTYREYINMGLCELMHCDAIYMLEGWENSTGAKLEYEYAVAVGLLVVGCKPEAKPFELTEKDRAAIESFVNSTIHPEVFDVSQAVTKMIYEIYRRGE